MTSVAARPGRGETEDKGIHFGLIELDLLATHTGVSFPFPLRVPSFGRIAGEREVLHSTAGATLRARGLADEDGPAGAAAEVVSALRQYRGTVDLVLADGQRTTGVLAMVYRSSALICTQVYTDDAAIPVRIRRVADNALAEELLRLVPEVPAARSMPISLPEKAVGSAVRLIEEVEDDEEKERRLRELFRDSGCDPDVLDHLVGLLPALTGRGQVGAARRSARDQIVRSGSELSWLDSSRGRVRVDRTGNGWMSVNPLRANDVRLKIHELSTTARTPGDG